MGNKITTIIFAHIHILKKNQLSSITPRNTHTHTYVRMNHGREMKLRRRKKTKAVNQALASAQYSYYVFAKQILIFDVRESEGFHIKK